MPSSRSKQRRPQPLHRTAACAAGSVVTLRGRAQRPRRAALLCVIANVFAAPRAELLQTLVRHQLPDRLPARRRRVAPRKNSRPWPTTPTPACRYRFSFDPVDDIAAPFIHRRSSEGHIRYEQGVNWPRWLSPPSSVPALRPSTHTCPTEATACTWLTSRPGGLWRLRNGDVLGQVGWAKSILFNRRCAQFEASSTAPTPSRWRNGCQDDVQPPRSSWRRSLAAPIAQTAASSSRPARDGRGSGKPADPALPAWQAMDADRGVPRWRSRGVPGVDDKDNALVSPALRGQRRRHRQPLPVQPERFRRTASPVSPRRMATNIMMPHPERNARSVQMSWHPADLGEDSPCIAGCSATRASGAG